MTRERPLYPYFILLLLCLPLFFLNIHDMHGWGDDFSQYIRQAMNIADGKAYYQSNYIFNPHEPEYGPPQYPPGFSILLAPVVKIWGLQFRPMIYLMAVCLSALLFVLFCYFRKYTNDIAAICLAVLCVYAGSIAEIKNQILSDIPCWLFIAIYFNLRKSPSFPPSRIILLVLSAIAAILIRSQAISIILAECLYLLVITVRSIARQRRLNMKDIFTSVSFKVSVATVLLFLTLNSTIFHTPNSTMQYYGQLLFVHEGTWWQAIGSNFNFFHDLMVRILHYYTNDIFWTTVCHFAVYMLITFIFIGFIFTIIRRFEVSHAYVIVMVLMMIILSQRQGVRFIISCIPFFMLYIHRAAHMHLPQLLRVRPTYLAIALTVGYLWLGKDDFRRYSYEGEDFMPREKDKTAFNYIKENISNDDVIIFAKPRALTLFTNKRAVVGSGHISFEDNRKFFNTLPGKKYVLVNDALNQGFYRSYIEQAHPATDTNVIAEGYTLYTLE